MIHPKVKFKWGKFLALRTREHENARSREESPRKHKRKRDKGNDDENGIEGGDDQN